MISLRILVRPLLATPFIIGGAAALKAPRIAAAKSADVSVPIADVVGLPKDPEMLVKINAGVQIGAGVMLTFGWAPRLAALLLGGSIIPTTIAGHRFWEETDAKAKATQLVQFAKNAGLLGGVLAVALDTGGRPSIFWSGSRAVGQAATAVSGTVNSALHALPGVD